MDERGEQQLERIAGALEALVLQANLKHQLDRIEATLAAVLTGQEKIMAAIDDLQAQVAQTATDVGAHLDALDASISTEITNAQAAITAALSGTGATPAQIKIVADALTALDTSLGTRVDTTKTKVDAAFPTPATPAATSRP
jgi:hypothetical protein